MATYRGDQSERTGGRPRSFYESARDRRERGMSTSEFGAQRYGGAQTFGWADTRRDEDRERRGTEVWRRGRWEREQHTAGEVMTRDVKMVGRATPIEEIARIMKSEECGIVPVVDESQKLIGVVTDRDIVVRAFADAKTRATAADVMTADVEAVTSDESLHEVVQLMAQLGVRRIPVVDREDRLLGIISITDIAHKADDEPALQDALTDVVARRSFWQRRWS